jgi:hypothetical protein
MAKGKKTNRNTMIYTILLRKLEIEHHQAHKNRVYSHVRCFCSINCTRRVTVEWHRYGNRVEHGCTKIYTNKIRHHLIYECPRIKDSHNPTRGFSDYDRLDLSQIDKFYSMLIFVHASVHYIVISFYYFVYDL